MRGRGSMQSFATDEYELIAPEAGGIEYAFTALNDPELTERLRQIVNIDYEESEE